MGRLFTDPSLVIELIRHKFRANISESGSTAPVPRRYQIASWLALILAGVCGITFYLLGALVKSYYYVGILGIVPAYGLSRWCAAMHSLQLLMRDIRSDWGRPVARQRDVTQIGESSLMCSADVTQARRIDDNTWADLNMDQVYAAIDRTCSTQGEVVLWKILASPEADDVALRMRNAAVHTILEDRACRESILLGLRRLGRERSPGITSLVWGKQPALSHGMRLLCSCLTLVALASVIAPFVWGTGALLTVIMPVFAVNVLVTHYVRHTSLYGQLSSIRYLVASIRCARGLGAIATPGLAPYCEILRDSARQTSVILRKAGWIRPERDLSGDAFELLNEYLGAYFLHEARTWYAVMGEVGRHIQEVRTLCLTLGEIDALQSVASFRVSLPHYAEPELLPGSSGLELENGQHPLLPDSVPNSIRIDSRGVIVTGSNMAGKSTFLRTIAVNALLAQTIFTCYAKAYRSGFFRILSSINTTDELVEGKSFFLREAEVLLAIIRAVESGVLCLCLVDELLIGTNSAERISASIEILKYLSDRGSIVVVSSHDLEIARLLQDRYDNYHFSDYYDDEGLRFDYVLKRGICTTRNALNLLDYVGYPKQIVEQARARLANYQQEMRASE